MKKLWLMILLSNACLYASPRFIDNYVNIDFDISMQKGTAEYERKYGTRGFNLSLLVRLKRLYQKYNISGLTPDATPRIPLIIHQIWVGPNPLPDFYKKLAQTWKQNHPDWTYMLWTDENVQHFKLENQELYDKATSYSEKANILRLELLHKFGGVYIDIDFECLKPLDVLHYYYDFYTGITPNNANAVLANGMIGCIPNHPLLTILVQEMKNYNHFGNQVERNGVKFFSTIVDKYLQQKHTERDIALPATYFYPFKKHYGSKITSLDYIRPESFAIHYWGATLAQKINLYHQKRTPSLLMD